MSREKQDRILRLIELGVYSCDEYGNIYSYLSKNGRGRLSTIKRKLYLSEDKNGYKIFTCGKRFVKQSLIKVHQFIYLYFNGRYNEHLTINHKDGNKKNNSLKNLELMTFGENTKHAHENNLVNYAKGSASYFSKLDEHKVIEIRLLLMNKMKQRDIAKAYNIHYASISAIKVGKSWKHLQ